VIPNDRQHARQPVPLIDPARCDLAVKDGLAVVAAPEACNYTGLCEAACPTQAIQRLFEIVILDEKLQEEVTDESY
jgi:NAD-dependent dihydropyrimidine dehydrogenase PreA subunit